MEAQLPQVARTVLNIKLCYMVCVYVYPEFVTQSENKTARFEMPVILAFTDSCIY